MAEVNLPSWSEISQASEGLQLNSTAATWENIFARLARIESRLLENERRAASTLPPLRPEPDPPDGLPLYPTAQPQFQSPFSPYQPATTFQQPHAAQLPQQYLQLQQPYQPPAPPPEALQWQQPQPELQNWRWQQHQPQTQPVQTRRPASWDPPGYRQHSGFMPYDRYPLPYHHREIYQPLPSPPCCWDPPAQQALHGFPPHNLPLRSVPYGISHLTNHPQQKVSFLEQQPTTVSDWNPSSLCSATTISPPCRPEFRVEGEHCDIPERGVSTESILATEATKIIDCGVAYSHAGTVSNQAIVLTSNISGDEGKLFDDGPPPPPSILPLYIPDVSEQEEVLFEDKEEDELINSLRTNPSKDLLIDSWHVARVSHRSMTLAADARLIPPRTFLGIHGRVVFDPGGTTWPKLLFETLFVVSWFPP